MFEAFLANTSTQGLSPLGTAPQRSFELISGIVRDELGEEHAALFAEPVATQYGDRFDWYATIAGKASPLTSLDTDARAAAEQRLEGLIAGVAALGHALLEKADPDQQRLGEALVNAVRYPGPESVFVVTSGEDGMQPVLLNWAWISDTQVAVKGDLSGKDVLRRAAAPAGGAAQAAASTMAAAAPIPVPPAAAVQDKVSPGRSRAFLWWLVWLGWLLLLLMFAAILYLMVEACALRIPGVPRYCPGPGPEASDVARESLWLRDRIATVERQIGIADRACQPRRQAAIQPAPVPEDTDFARLRARGATEGDLTISLLWNTIADLHLDVRCPGNQVINFDNRSACGGRLDIGGNHDVNTAVTDAMENMFFNTPAAGPYAIKVSLYDAHGQAPTQEFRLRINDEGVVRVIQGSVSAGQSAWTTNHIVGEVN